LKILLLLIIVFTSSKAVSQTWQILPDSPVADGRFEDVWFINENTGWVVERHSADKILKTIDGGKTWDVKYYSATGNSLRSVAFNNENLGWVGALNGILLKTVDGGENWIRVDTLINPSPPGVCDIAVVGDSVFYGAGKWSGPARLIKTTNAGATFESINLSNYASSCIGVYFLNKDTGFVGGVSNIPSEGSVILYTTNGGGSFTKVYTSNVQPEHVWYILQFNEDIFYASVQHFSPNKMYYVISTNGGMNWTRSEIPGSNQYAEAIAFVDNMSKGFLTSGAGNGMYVTSNGGTNWTYTNFGQRIHSMFVVNDTTIYACGMRIYKYTSEIVGIQNYTSTVPEDFQILYQNYPNPFNPITTIKFYLKLSTHVKMRVYDVKGELISTLLNENRNSGTHEVIWNADEIPSGIYFYSIMTDEGILYKKAVVLK
jgi:photosystem II stability/assembly factor-like uncharacterized protein